MEKLFIPILLGTAREGRQSEKVANYVLEQAKAYGQFETELLDVRDFVHVSTFRVAKPEEKHEAAPARSGGEWSSMMKRANGLIVVAPEYNHGYPGELKLMLDQLYEEYGRKPAGICGVSAGQLGGARMVEVLRTALIELGMVPVRNAVYFSQVQDLFDEKGVMQDLSYGQRLNTMFEELVWYANALKVARS